LGAEEARTMMSTVKEALKELRSVSTNATTLFVGRVKAGESEPLATEFFKTGEVERPTVVNSEVVPPAQGVDNQ